VREPCHIAVGRARMHTQSPSPSPSPSPSAHACTHRGARASTGVQIKFPHRDPNSIFFFTGVQIELAHRDPHSICALVSEPDKFSESQCPSIFTMGSLDITKEGTIKNLCPRMRSPSVITVTATATKSEKSVP